MDSLSRSHPASSVRVWKMLDELVLEVYRATRRFPAEERDGLVPALRRAAVAAAVPLAAGEEAPGEPGLAALERARVRLAELRYYIYLARRLRLIDALSYRGISARHERSLRALDRLRASRRPSEAPSSWTPP